MFWLWFHFLRCFFVEDVNMINYELCTTISHITQYMALVQKRHSSNQSYNVSRFYHMVDYKFLPLIICYRLLDSNITADYCILISLFHWEYLVRLLLQYNFLFCFTLFNLFNFRINILFNYIDLIVNCYFLNYI